MKRRIVFVLAALALASPAGAKSILFVGNSFTFGAGTRVQVFHPERVTDLNGEGIGGVPALFQTFARELKLDWQVSLETSPGKDLAWHLDNRRALIERSWDVVLLQGYSTLDKANPGNRTRHVAAARQFGGLLVVANPRVKVLLVSTWARADQVYRPDGHWYGRSVADMAQDLAAANCAAIVGVPQPSATIPVGLAWNRAMQAGLADANPFDGISPGSINLWGADNYHASVEGYYLEALVEFGAVTGIDPRKLGRKEIAARELGIGPRQAAALQRIAAEQLRAKACS